MISKIPWKILEYTCKKTKQVIKVDEKIMALRYCLVNGQAFNWHPYTEEVKEDDHFAANSDYYHGVLRNYYVQFRTDKKGYINYRAIPDDQKL